MNTHALTFTRFIAAFIVVIFHFGSTVYPFNNGVFIDLFLSKGDAAVSYFFVLSGFIMSIAYQKTVDWRIFYKNRFARIFPNFIFAIILFLIISRVFFPIEGILNFFVIHAWFPKYALSINFPDWTISVEFFFYLLFPFLTNYIYQKKSFKFIFIYIFAFWVISQVIFFLLGYLQLYQDFPSEEHAFFFRFPLLHLSEFLIGNLSALFLIRYENTIKRWSGDIISLTSFIGMILFLALPIPQLSYHNGLLSLFFIGIIYGLSMASSKISKLFRKKSFVLLGEMSFGIYLFQYPVHLGIEKVFNKIGLNDYPFLLFYMFLMLLLTFSYINYKYFETPMRNKIKNL